MYIKQSVIAAIVLFLYGCSFSLDSFEKKPLEPAHCFFANKKYSQGAPTIIGKTKFWCHNGQWQEQKPVIYFAE